MKEDLKKDIIQISGAIVSFIIVIMFLFALYTFNSPKGIEGDTTLTLFDFFETRFKGIEFPPHIVAIVSTYTFALICAILATVFFIISIYCDNEKIFNFAIANIFATTLLSLVGTIFITSSISIINEIAPLLDLTYESLSIGASAITIPLFSLALSILIIILKYVKRIKE